MELLVCVKFKDEKETLKLRVKKKLEGKVKQPMALMEDIEKFINEIGKVNDEPKPAKTEQEASEQPEVEEAEEEVPEQSEPKEAEEEVPEQSEAEEAGKETPQQLETEEAEEEAPQQPEPEEAEAKNFEQPKPTKTKLSKKKEVQEIPELTKIAEQSSSYEDFVKNVGLFIGVGSKLKFFQGMVNAAEEAEKISWNNIEEIMRRNGETFNSYGKILCTNQVAATFKNSENPVTILKLVKAVVEYKDYNFKQEASQNSDPFTISEEKPVEEKASVHEEPSKVRVKMACMPTIPTFEELLGGIDKTWPIEERVKHVLSAMTSERRKGVPDRFIEIATVAVNSEQEPMDIESIMAKTHIRREDVKETRLTFAKFISDFAKKNGSKGKVKLIDFLQDLRKIVK